MNDIQSKYYRDVCLYTLRPPQQSNYNIIRTFIHVSSRLIHQDVSKCDPGWQTGGVGIQNSLDK